MRIAHVVHESVPAYSGLLTAVANTAKGLAQSGFDVEVWQFGPWHHQPADLETELLAAGVELVPYPRLGPARPPDHSILRAIHARHVDVVHIHGVFNPGNNLLARRLERPYVVSPHGGYAPEVLAHHRWRKLVFKHAFELRMLNGAEVICALTDEEARQISDYGTACPVAVIPNVISPVPEDLDRDALRRSFDLGPTQRLAVYAGRLDVRAKRLDDLLRGVEAAPNWHVALIGPDFKDQRVQLERLSHDLGIHSRVHLMSPRRGRRLFDALAGGDVFVLLSRSEGLPMAVLEALACGTPALVSPEVERSVGVERCGAGWVVDPRTAAEGLGLFDRVGDADLRAMRDRAVLLAREHTWKNVEDRWRVVLEAASRP
jgi:glycosyltransferase involved in cell wall biosynthesis